MRRRARVDTNHAEIVEALRANGWDVLSLAPLGYGVPDLLIARLGECSCGYIVREWRLVEVKDGSKPPSAQKLTKAERDFHQRWPVTILTSVEDALHL